MSEQNQTSVLVPAPTAWPLMVALGFTLIFAGVVTHAVVSIVGAVVLLRAAVGWWYDVLPAQKEEVVVLEAEAPVEKSQVPVNYLSADHRKQFPLEVHPYSSGFWGGLAGAVAMAAVAILFGLISERSIWYPINLLSAVMVRPLAEASTEEL